MAFRGFQAAIAAAQATTTVVDFSLRTFNVYVGSIARALRVRYTNTSGELDEGLLIDEILGAQRSASPRLKDRLDAVESALRRAWATERLLRRTFGATADLDMKRDALHWLPAQAYYAIYSALTALLECHNMATRNHMGALNSFGASFARLLPSFPLGVGCDGHDGAWKFSGFTTSPVPTLATKISNTEPDWCHHIAQGLKSTREADVENDIDEWKRRNKKKRIPKTERTRLTANRKKTTVPHLFWRLRRRANYGDVDLFLYEPTKVGDLNSFAAAMLWVVSCFVAAFEALIERRIGKAELEKMIRRFPDPSNGPVEFIAKRWRLP
jgi:hypothetical protein